VIEERLNGMTADFQMATNIQMMTSDSDVCQGYNRSHPASYLTEYNYHFTIYQHQFSLLCSL